MSTDLYYHGGSESAIVADGSTKRTGDRNVGGNWGDKSNAGIFRDNIPNTTDATGAGFYNSTNGSRTGKVLS